MEKKISSVMFVCLGNICRSPMAEFIFKDMLEKSGLEGDVIAQSSATSDENVYRGVGAQVYPPAKRILSSHGISCEGKRAVQLRKSDYEKYDLFVCMDSSNVRNARYIFGGDKDNKIRKLMDFTSRPGNVADPWYTDDFETAYDDIVLGCKGLLEYIKGD